jgi:hypothetical protein
MITIEETKLEPGAGQDDAVAGRPLWKAGAPLPANLFAAVRRRAMLDHCKWDAQVGDVATLADFPLILPAPVWRSFATMAEALTAEMFAAEDELLRRPELWERLGLPRSIRTVLRQWPRLGLTPAAARSIRFDFHLTPEGWRISEANCDAPGGFSEASSFTEMMAAHYPGLVPAGNPVKRWCDAIAAAAGGNGTLALLSAPGFMEDHQIMAYLAGHLRLRGCAAQLASPLQLEWRDGFASLNSTGRQCPLHGIVRFYQAEWIVRLPRRCGWRHFFAGGRTPVANPGSAIITESKRFPLVWDDLRAPLPTWRKLLPETRDPRDAPWQNDEDWLLKTAICNTGDTVSIRALMNEQQWRSTERAARRRPREWLAQRRFEPITLATPGGRVHPCIGVYTVNGRAAGAYARLAPRPLIDFAAIDIALLIEDGPADTTHDPK